MSTAVKVENISKKYVLSHEQQSSSTSLRDVINQKAKSIGKRIIHPSSSFDISRPNKEEFWALNDVSFEIKQGDRVGIIGRNGAGKSTLLKVLSRIVEPTSGRIGIKGRVASLLEVGTGFHPELTGRENIFLNGAILGMGKQEIQKKFDEIVDFAEVEKFLDTPVKRYSSGMYVRLAFAVAAHLEPEILIVDEVLAVGDAQFQKKCLGKMKDVGDEGRTVIFVSHNMTALNSLCSSAILLEKGHVKRIGETNYIISGYLQTSKALLEQVWDNPKDAPGNDKVRIRSASIKIDGNQNDNIIRVDTPIKMEFQFWNFVNNQQLNFSMVISNLEGVAIFNTVSNADYYGEGLIKGSCFIPANLLNDETYSIMIMIVKDTSVPLFSINDILILNVHEKEREGNWYGKWVGVVRPELQWKTEMVNENDRGK